jgi:Bifunctional DNA primase/polymerase, N-terminal
MTDATLRQALAYARRGWPVFPCLPGQKIPATRHGYRDATTDQQQISNWFGRGAHWNLAIATGAPGPDVLDIDQHGPAGNGFAAFAKLRRGGLADGAAAYVRTPAGGMHAYFTGSDQHNGRLPSHHLDFRSAGGYILAPPSQVNGNPYQLIKRLDGCGRLDWNAVTQLLEPQHMSYRPQLPSAAGLDLTHLTRWVASQPEGNRNAGLFWAANRALDANRAADLCPLAVAARRAGLGDKEITRTLDSARRTSQHRADPRDRQAEAGELT